MIKISAFGQCADDSLGTGIGKCPITDFGDLKGAGLLNKGTTIPIVDGEVALTEANFKALITDGKLHQIHESFAFEDTTPENENETSSDGLMRSVRAGKPMYAFTFKKGMGFHKALYSLRGQDRWDLILYFTKGILMAKNTSSTAIKGFNGGMFDVDSYKFTVGTDTEFSKAKKQLKNAEEFNANWVFFPYDELGYNALEIDGVIQTYATISNPLAEGATDIQVKLVDDYNRSISYAELFDAAADWKVLVNGTAVTISAVSITGEIVYLTIPALDTNDVVKVSLNGIVTDVEGKFYKSNVISTVVS
jgi:hypothetical protein